MRESKEELMKYSKDQLIKKLRETTEHYSEKVEAGLDRIVELRAANKIANDELSELKRRLNQDGESSKLVLRALETYVAVKHPANSLHSYEIECRDEEFLFLRHLKEIIDGPNIPF